MAPPFPFDRPVALVGMPGVGKSSVGRLLAIRLGTSFNDSDEEVAREAGRSVEQLFRSEGEAGFRERERRAIARITGLGPAVIATGGGAMVEAETRRLLLSRATTIWLQATAKVLAQRLSDADSRPLLKGEGLLSKLDIMQRERRPCYAQAHIHLDTEDLGPAAIAEAAAAAIAIWAEDRT